MALITGYPEGSNITLLNTIYIKPQKDDDGKYGSDYLYIIYKDLNTGEKKFEMIKEPKYTYWVTNEGVPVLYNKLFIEKHNVHPVTCKYSELKKSIAETTNNLEWFYDNIRSGNYRENEKLLLLPNVFMADMNVEDFYRFEFAKQYKNEPFNPTKLYFDIETDIIHMRGDFPEPGECPVNACTVVDDINKRVYCLLLTNNLNPLIDEFMKEPDLDAQIKEFVKDKVGGWKNEIRFGLQDYVYKFAFFDEEINLIRTIFNLINKIKPDFALAWNMAFDLPYLIARCYTLGYDPRSIICSPDMEQKICDYFIDHRADKFEERGDGAFITSYSVYMDQLIAFASRRKGQRAIASFKLDYVGDKIAKVRKLDYSHITTSIAKLPYLDYKVFAFYNVMDTIVQLCIEKKVSDIDFVYTKSISTNTRYAKVHRQTTYLVNRGISDFWKMDYVMGDNINKSNSKEGFAGAFVADPTLVSDKPKKKINGKAVNLLDNLDDYDYKALYPSIIYQNNMAPNTMHGKIILLEQIDPHENRFNNEYFNRSVWFIEDYVSGNVIDFCVRYLHMASYEELYDDINIYYTTIKNPSRGLRTFNSMIGKFFLYNKINNEQKRCLYRLVDNTKKRELIRTVERIPNYDKYIDNGPSFYN